MDSTVNVINWFQIPVADLVRAKKFYETIFEIKMDSMEMNGMKMAFFPMEQMSGKVSGCIVLDEKHKPANGVIIYLNGNPDLSVALGKVEAAGGKIAMPKTLIKDDVGYMAYINDSEGNTMALHSNK